MLRLAIARIGPYQQRLHRASWPASTAAAGSAPWAAGESASTLRRWVLRRRVLRTHHHHSEKPEDCDQKKSCTHVFHFILRLGTQEVGAAFIRQIARMVSLGDREVAAFNGGRTVTALTPLGSALSIPRQSNKKTRLCVKTAACASRPRE